MSKFFFHSISETHLENIDVDLDSVICYIDVESDKKEVKTEIVENGFGAQMDQDMCDTKMPKESQSWSDDESCPVGPQKAALLYPLRGEGIIACAVDVWFWCSQKEHPLFLGYC